MRSYRQSVSCIAELSGSSIGDLVKIILWIIGIIFLIGLLVVIGAGKLIF